LGMVATRFVEDARQRMRMNAASAVECFQCDSALGVRQHLTALRDLAERRARIERNLLYRSPSCARLRRATDEALEVLDSGSHAQLAHSLERVEALAR
jgi:hypothetical protein